MKKLLSLVMVCMLVLSLCVAAFATENTGSITITNATIDETYTIYKIFDASINVAAGSDTADAVAYSIQSNDQFFAALFGADGTADNTYFVYNSNTGSVTKKEGVNDSELIQYLTELVQNGSYNYVDDAVAASDEVKFEDIPYGYYLITSSLGTTVTINSNTPDVEVIDKNQVPGVGFDKLVQTGVDAEGNPIWGESNSASIGDKITYQIAFTATNYDGDKKIKYYQIHDEKGEAIWVEFNSVMVKIDGEEYTKGYYLPLGGDNTDNWEYLGDWSEIPEAERDRNDADWYLVHLGYDQFRITIPWLENHTITDVTDDEGNVIAYTVDYAEGAASKYDSPSEVEITYSASVEPSATIGTNSHGNRFNKANATWTSENETGSTPPEEVVTYVYGLGLLKDDKATGMNLAGAKFRIYRDSACTDPVYVIPTNVDGVYIVDSLGTYGENMSGSAKETAREIYADYLAEYLGGNTQDNYVVSQANGKLVILGLEAGSYFLKEVEAPAGYNALTAPIELVAGTEIRPFFVFADVNGNVADIQTTDGVHAEIRYELTHTVVHNSKGVVLPSTGGTGTVWLITLGSLFVIGFAVFLITHKKMSVYVD